MVAYEVQEGFAADEFATAEHSVTVAAGIALGDETHPVAQSATCCAVGGLIAWADHHAELLDARGGGLFEDDLKGGFCLALLVDQHLKGQAALPWAGGGDEGFADFHGGIGGMGIVPMSESPTRIHRQDARARIGTPEIDKATDQVQGQVETIPKVDQSRIMNT
jgi:hypothetical protein